MPGFYLAVTVVAWLSSTVQYSPDLDLDLCSLL